MSGVVVLCLTVAYFYMVVRVATKGPGHASHGKNHAFPTYDRLIYNRPEEGNVHGAFESRCPSDC